LAKSEQEKVQVDKAGRTGARSYKRSKDENYAPSSIKNGWHHRVDRWDGNGCATKGHYQKIMRDRSWGFVLSRVDERGRCCRGTGSSQSIGNEPADGVGPLWGEWIAYSKKIGSARVTLSVGNASLWVSVLLSLVM
jgi:hypothetical protein